MPDLLSASSPMMIESRVSIKRCRIIYLLQLDEGPVKDIVIQKVLAGKEITKDLAQIGIVGTVIEAKGAHIVEVDGKFGRVAATKRLGAGGHFLLHDSVVLLLLGACLEPLPGQRSPTKVEQNVA